MKNWCRLAVEYSRREKERQCLKTCDDMKIISFDRCVHNLNIFLTEITRNSVNCFLPYPMSHNIYHIYDNGFDLCLKSF